MKETPVSNVEKNFILSALEDNKRIDGRSLNERRDISIDFGREDGCCVCTLGRTRVLAQASCSIVEPRATRPNEGLLMINVNFTPMCAPRFVDRSSGPGNPVDEEITEVSRLLERLLKESRCLDMESLCISAEEKVWEIRLDIHVLNHEGNVADCAGVAGLAALAHFKRPDVSLEGDIVKVYSTSERDPIPLALHHFPVCSTFAFFKPNKSQSSTTIVSGTPSAESENETSTTKTKKCDRIVVCDPNHNEEAIMDGKLVLGINPYKEICTLHLAGKMIIDKAYVLKLTHSAAETAKEIVDMLKDVLKKDENVRKETAASRERSGKAPDIGLAANLRKASILQLSQNETCVDIAKDIAHKMNINDVIDVDIEDDALDIETIPSTKKLFSSSDESESECNESSESRTGINSLSDEDDIQAVKSVSAEEKRKNRILAEINVDDDSEEETTTTVGHKDINTINR